MIYQSIAAFRASLREANDGSICLHPGDLCNRILIDTGHHYPVVDTRHSPPRKRWDVSMACLCNCRPCKTLREARHQIMGTDDSIVGLVDARKAAEYNAMTSARAEQRGWFTRSPDMAEQEAAYVEDLAELLAQGES